VFAGGLVEEDVGPFSAVLLQPVTRPVDTSARRTNRGLDDGR